MIFNLPYFRNQAKTGGIKKWSELGSSGCVFPPKARVLCFGSRTSTCCAVSPLSWIRPTSDGLGTVCRGKSCVLFLMGSSAVEENSPPGPFKVLLPRTIRPRHKAKWNLLGMGSNLLAMSSNPIAMASNQIFFGLKAI